MKLLGLISFIVFGQNSIVFADSERIIHYQYDAAGNLIGISSAVNQNPPDVIAISPGYINIGQIISFVATGTNLNRTTVSVSEAGLFISNVVSSQNSVAFNIMATTRAEAGNATLTFTTRLGSDSEFIVVARQLTDLVTQPAPISVAPDGNPNQIKLIFVEPRATEETYIVSITDTSIAEVSQSSITIPQGASEATLDITGLLIGNTELELNNSTQLFFYSLPVYVADKLSGDGEAFSSAVGITVGVEDVSGGNNNSILSSAVGITVGIEDVSGGNNNSILSSAVGVTVGSGDPIENVNNPILSITTGLIVGSVVDNIQPVSLGTGTLINFTISGYNLENVNTVVIEPADDLILSGLTINPEGTEITFSIDAGVTAQTGIRNVLVSSPSGEIESLTGAPIEIDIQ